MLPTISLKEKLEYLPSLLSRLSPFIITEIDNQGKKKQFMDAISDMKPFVLLEDVTNPKQLFDFFKNHSSDLIIIMTDVFLMRKNYRDIIMGAFCSSPDSGGLWSVSYRNEKEFIFKGKLILCTNKTKDQITKEEKFSKFARDGHFI